MRKAFTLIELLVVIVIIGVLAAMTTVALGSVRAKARDTKRIADIRNLQSALEIYKNDNGVYPTFATSGTALVANGQTYMAKIPTAPTNTGSDVYTYTSTSPYSSYQIAYNLEKGVQDTGSGNWVAIPGQISSPGSSGSAPASVPYALRDTGPGGGWVFYIYNNGQNGLEAAKVDQGSTIPWGKYGTSVPGTSIATGTGQANTTLIVNKLIEPTTETGRAAQLADDLVLNTKDDWFLPSKNELDLMYINLKKGTDQNGASYTPNFGGFVADAYWSSSEFSANYAWYQDFGSGGQNFTAKHSTTYVRAVRAF